MKILHRCSSTLIALAGVFLMLLLVAMPATAADSTGPDCSFDSIKAAFNARYPGATGATVPEVKTLQSLLIEAGHDPQRIDGYLGGDTYKALAEYCSAVKTDLLSTLLDQGNTSPSPVELANTLLDLLSRAAELSRAADRPPYLGKLLSQLEDTPKKIRLNGGDCGCSRDFVKLVYGFLPYWLADGKEHIVDFSLYDRIGYFALNLNEHGHISNRLHFPADVASFPNIAGFINQAHKHRVAVDVTFVASTWQNWNADQINNAADNILATVTREYQVEEPSWWRKLLPLVKNNSTAHADGINLYFDRYEKPEEGKILTKIVKEIRLRLKGAQSDAKLNIMLGFDLAKLDRRGLSIKGQAAQKTGAKFTDVSTQFRKLEARFTQLKDILVSEPEIVDNVFVFLSDYTSQSKKDLRQLIENAFDGEARRTVIRKMLPIVSVQGLAAKDPANDKSEEKNDGGKSAEESAEQDSQFDDDLIYVQDNFAGIGLWRLPLTEKADEDNSGEGESEEDGAKKDSTPEDSAEKEGAESAHVDTATAEAMEKLKQAEALQEAADKDLEEKNSALQEAQDRLKPPGSDSETAASKDKALKTAKQAVEAASKNAETANEAVEKAKADLAVTEKLAADKMATEEDVKALQEALQSKFQRSSQFAWLGAKFEIFEFNLCEWACPNRWVFRIAFDVLVVLALLYALCALGDCRLRELYQRRFIWFAGFGFIIAMVFAVSALCDPFWKERAIEALVVMPLLILGGWGISRLRKRNQPKLP